MILLEENYDVMVTCYGDYFCGERGIEFYEISGSKLAF